MFRFLNWFKRSERPSPGDPSANDITQTFSAPTPVLTDPLTPQGIEASPVQGRSAPDTSVESADTGSTLSRHSHTPTPTLLGDSVPPDDTTRTATGPSDTSLATTFEAPSPAPIATLTAGPPAPPPGLQHVAVAGYEILGLLGRGGMGVVYQARHTQLKRLVALKMILSGGHADAVQVARFRLEAEAVARLQHPHIVQIYEIGVAEGRPYFSLEFVGGGSLKDKIAGTPWPAGKAAMLVEQLARAMHAAHQSGIIHRDLKPANILMTPEGTPKITDFGLAKQLDDDSGQTHSGAIMGTPSYMAPEQALGRIALVGPVSDVYALAAILYELLTGRPPFRAATVLDTLDQVRHQEPVPPTRLQPRIPRDLETICMKGLQKEPRRRYASAQELADDLKRFLAGEPIMARPVGVVERGIKWARRRPKDAALAGVAVMLLMGLVGSGLAFQIHRARAAEQRLQSHVTLESLVSRGEQGLASARNQQDLRSARDLFTEAMARMGEDASFAELRGRAATGLEGIDRRLEDEDALRVAEEKYQAFQRLRDDALFHETLFTGLDAAANVEATRSAAAAALDLFEAGPNRDRVRLPRAFYDAQRQAEIREGCYEMYLVLASAEAQARPGEDAATQARKALKILERADRFDISTRVQHLRRARYLAQLDQGAQAKETLEKARQIVAESPVDFFHLGMEAYKNGDVAGARRQFEEAQRRRPDHYWTQNFLAICHLRAHGWDKAVAALTACLARRPDFVWLHLLRGHAYGELHAFEAAQADFARAEELLQQRPDRTASYGLHVNRGVMWVRAGDVQKDPEHYKIAVRDCQQAIRLLPKQYQAYANLAQTYQRLGQLDEAVAQLDRALALEPKLGSLYSTRARLHLKREDRTSARRDFEQAIALEPAGSKAIEHVDNLVHLGRIQHQERRLDAALASYDTALRLQKDFALAHRWRAEALIDQHRYEEAAAAFDAFFEHWKGKPAADVFRERGLVRARLGDLSAAIDDYSRAIEIEPTDATYSHRGWAYLLSDAHRLALPDFQRALEVNPKNGDAYAGRGFTRVKLGQHRAGVADAEKALTLAASSPRTLYHAARIFAQAGALLDGALSRSDQELRSLYYQRAMALLQQAFKSLPAADRQAFWKDFVMSDAALNPLRRSAAFGELARESAASIK